MQQFLHRRLAITEFRETFDRKTKKEWDLFGLQGLSGAMFLNKLVKHLSDQDELTRELQTAIAVPADEAAARLQLDDLTGYLDRKIEEGAATRADLEPNRALLLVSAIWHMQRPDLWPILYGSARKALMTDGEHKSRKRWRCSGTRRTSCCRGRQESARRSLPADEADSAWLPQMLVDVMLTSSDRRVVVETKYYCTRPHTESTTARGSSYPVTCTSFSHICRSFAPLRVRHPSACCCMRAQESSPGSTIGWTVTGCSSAAST